MLHAVLRWKGLLSSESESHLQFVQLCVCSNLRSVAAWESAKMSCSSKPPENCPAKLFNASNLQLCSSFCSSFCSSILWNVALHQAGCVWWTCDINRTCLDPANYISKGSRGTEQALTGIRMCACVQSLKLWYKRFEGAHSACIVFNYFQFSSFI